MERTNDIKRFYVDTSITKKMLIQSHDDKGDFEMELEYREELTAREIDYCTKTAKAHGQFDGYEYIKQCLKLQLVNAPFDVAQLDLLPARIFEELASIVPMMGKKVDGKN